MWLGRSRATAGAGETFSWASPKHFRTDSLGRKFLNYFFQNGAFWCILYFWATAGPPKRRGAWSSLPPALLYPPYQLSLRACMWLYKRERFCVHKQVGPGFELATSCLQFQRHPSHVGYLQQVSAVHDSNCLGQVRWCVTWFQGRAA